MDTTKRNKKRSIREKRDRTTKKREKRDMISGLTDELVHHILSFLDTRAAVQTCILSKRWVSVWKSLPYLHFSYPTATLRRTREEEARVLRSFTSFITHLIAQRYHTNLVRVRLNCNYHKIDPLVAQSLICYAVQHNVRELEVDFTSDLINYTEWVWPLSFYDCESLTQLTLRNSHYYHRNNSIQLPRYMSLSALKSLNLANFIMNEDTFDSRIFSTCPNLETLELSPLSLDGLKTLRIHALNLKKLYFFGPRPRDVVVSFEIQHRCKLEIHAPKLKTFEHYGCCYIVHATECFASLDDVRFDPIMQGFMDEQNFPYLMNTIKEFQYVRSLTISMETLEENPSFLSYQELISKLI